ncbi:hypothetical protein [Leptolyngbya sp. CCY15150]|uniref:hypothetical protein n=1 Tax=Leptolyngbya sp. CCY15150 TaxID=2767772 RepID=UPI00195006D8|nr:hypothetical protein [Leptolyngbya sp. CCY15150]
MELLSYASILMGLVATISGAIAWYRSTVRKQYASERDFNHIRSSIAQLAQGIADQDKFTEEHLSRLSNRIDTMNSTMTEIKVYLMAKMGDNTIGRGKR